MPHRCAYCWYLEGNTKDHILPRSVAHVVGHYKGDIVPSCKWCNSSKGDLIKLPTINNIYGIFKNFSNKQLADYAEYCYCNWERIALYKRKCEEEIQRAYKFLDKYVKFDTFEGMYQHDWEQFLILWNNGYFEDLDSHRVDPYSTNAHITI